MIISSGVDSSRSFFFNVYEQCHVLGKIDDISILFHISA